MTRLGAGMTWLLLAVTCLCLSPSARSQPPARLGDSELRIEFAKRWAAYVKRMTEISPERVLNPSSKGPRHFQRCEEYERLIELGPQAAHIFIEEISAGEWRLMPALVRITKWKYELDPESRQAIVVTRRGAVPSSDARSPEPNDFVQWWRSRPETPVRFDRAYKDWKELNRARPMILETTQRIYDNQRKLILTETTKSDLGRAYDRLREFGIDALPVIVEKIKAGDHDLLPIFAELTDGIGEGFGGTLAERAEYVLREWEMHSARFLLPPVSAAKLKDAKR